MTKNKTNSRLPRSKGIDVATCYEPKECVRRVKRFLLPEDNRRIVDEFLSIYGMKEVFGRHDVPIPNKLVLYGPPGTGKTLTAFHIASSLNLPLVMVRLDAIIHSHLGETGSNIRKIFDYARSAPCVLFLDEFDAIARTRETNDEVKEMARAVNSLLQCLDEFDGDSVLIAATNLADQLDHAIWRRFDTKIRYDMPDDESRGRFIRMLLGDFEREEDIFETADGMLGSCSFADLEQIVLKAKRKAIIEGVPLRVLHLKHACSEYMPA